LNGLRRIALPAAALILTGALLGSLLAAAAPPTYTARGFILLAPSPSFLVTGLAEAQTPEETTIDTEAALALGDESLQRVRGFAGSPAALRRKVSVTAVPNTQVLVFEVADRDAAHAEFLVRELSASYLESRARALQQRRTEVLTQLRNRASQLTSLGTARVTSDLLGQRSHGAVGTELREVDAAINAIVLTPTTAGEVLRQDHAKQKARDFPLLSASGAALGLLLALLLTPVQSRLRARDQRSQRRETLA
jgi:uncharacterized protein involved in exopolysaccharide biosynthesis